MTEKKEIRQPSATTSKKPPLKSKNYKLIGILILVILIGLGAVFTKKPIFGLDGIFGFYAVFGFISAAGFIVVSQFIIGALLKRKDTYYDD